MSWPESIRLIAADLIFYGFCAIVVLALFTELFDNLFKSRKND
jgi:hypothetical protein